MSEHQFKINDLIKELQDLCQKLADMLSTGYSYSPRSLIEEFHTWFKTQQCWASVDQEKKNLYLHSKDLALNTLNFYTYYTLHPTISAFNSLSEVPSEIQREKAEKLVKLLTEPLIHITRSVINEWFVKTVRDAHGISAHIFDNYNLLKKNGIHYSLNWK